MRSHIIAVLGATTLATIVGLVTPTPVAGASVDTKRLVESGSPANAGQWMSYGRDYSEQRYSPLERINADNASQLGLAWYSDLSERGGSYEAEACTRKMFAPTALSFSTIRSYPRSM